MNVIKKKIYLLYNRSLSTMYSIWGNYDKAISYLHNITEKEEVNSTDWWKLGVLWVAKGDWEEAKKAFLKALSDHKKNPQYLFWLGKAEAYNDNLVEAEKLYDEALENKADFLEALLAKGQLLMNREEYEEAFRYFLNSIKITTGSAEIYNNAGLCQMNLNNLDSAEEFFEKALKLKSRDPVMIYNYGMVMLKKGCYEQAIAEMSKLIPEGKAEVFSSLGYCYSSLEKYTESLELYLKALQAAPEDRENLVNLACIYARLGENSKALEIIKKLLLVNPYDINILNNIAWIYENLGNYGEAEKYYSRGLALAPDNPDLMYNMICCLDKQNKYSEAMEIIDKLKAFPEWSSMAWTYQAQIYEKIGEANLAVDCYNKALGLE